MPDFTENLFVSNSKENLGVKQLFYPKRFGSILYQKRFNDCKIILL